MSNTQLSTIRSILLEQFNQLALFAFSFNALQQDFVEGLGSICSTLTTLKLSFLARRRDPTPHIRIHITEGICGAAIAATKSEIVVPIYAHGKVVGEIDIVIIILPHSQKKTGSSLRKRPAS